jgi:serine/threonine-protein kinase
LIQMQLQETPPPLRMLRPDIPPAIETLVHQMMAKDAAQRPQSVQEVTARFARELALTSDGLAATETAGMGWKPAVSSQTANAAAFVPVNSRKTELMSDAPTPRRFEVVANNSGAVPGTAATLPQTSPRRSLLLPGALLGAALAGGGLALYRYTSDPGAEPIAQVQPTPTATVAPSLPSATPIETAPPINTALKPKPSVKAAITPTPGIAPSTPPPAKPESKNNLPLVTSKPSTENPPVTNNTANNEATRWPLADGLYQQALKQYEAGNYKVALNLCNQSLRIRPMHQGARQLKMKLQSGMRILNNPQ